ncbi:DUF885 family protein [Glaciecola sp. XM2]|uniref:DUF885 domain-containing protein n=1 Tax=Glaciecola sp. XM2 TaxID=1914931 RepID=UPI001BDE62FA|nr:DUF885 domain-containing protein [Glaciecola sp. XM2]MBT1451914.1 DUF885 family protein [Glaciecola sp. XM2]
MKALIISITFTLLSLTAQAIQSENDNSQKLHTLLEQVWEYELSQFPSMARSEGREPQQSLTDISMSAMQARFEQFTAFQQQLNEIELASLNNDDQISHLMQNYRLSNYIDNFRFKEYRVPITSEFGFHSSLGRIPDSTRIGSQQDFDRYMRLLDAVPHNMQLNVQYMKEGLALGHSQPQVVLIGYEDSITPFIGKTIQEHPFYAPIIGANNFKLTEQQKAEAAQKVANVQQAYQDFYDFFVNDYQVNTKTDIAATTWPQGDAFYKNRMKHYTTADLSAQEIHDIGLAEVARIRAEMQQIIDDLEFDGDINAFIEFLRTDEQFYAKTAEELIMVASYISKQMDARLPQLFYKMPRTPYGVAPVPDSIAPKYTTGRYISPSSDDEPGYYWVNTYALDKRPLYALPALTLHEAVPGHHFQISLAAEMEDLPNVRRKTYISAFGEGWGLYSEYLGLEVGIYEDPYDNFGRLSYEMWRACRLVVDTGMHVFGWSRDKALAYMLENTALSEHNVRTEIDRYISWPAQALSYKIGEIKIKELRAKAQQTLGNEFDLRAFHDELLAHGSVPLFILERNVNNWITAQQTN